MFSKMKLRMNRDAVKAQEVEWRTNLRNGEVDGHLLTKGWSKASRLVKKGLCWISWRSQTAPPLGRWSWNCGMMRWRRSTWEGTIYRTKWARVNLTYHFAVSMKSEDTQGDMVTVHTVIKGLYRWFDRERLWSGDILLCEISWSIHRQPCNGNIADGRIKWGYPSGRIRCFTE